MNNDHVVIYMTDYGQVRLSEKTLAWLASLDENWHAISTSRRYRSKHAQRVRERVQQMESAIGLMAEISYMNDEPLDTF